MEFSVRATWQKRWPSVFRHGHDISFGTRTPDKLADWMNANPKAGIASVSDAADGELVVLAVKGTAAVEVLRAAGAGNLDGKPVMQCTNPIADVPPSNGVLTYFTNHDESLMERLQREFKGARFVKAFNSVGNNRYGQLHSFGRQAHHVHLRQR